MLWRKLSASLLLLASTASAVSIEIGPKSQGVPVEPWIVAVVVLALLVAFRKQILRLFK